MTTNTNTVTPNFFGMGIAPGILQTLEGLKFLVPTPIQIKAIPIGLAGTDIIGIAQTGTGKTLAFAIPIVQRLAQIRGRALVLVPTRELAIQVEETIKKIAGPSGMGSVVLIGGESMLLQIHAMRKNPRIIIATPGRLLDHIGSQRIRLDDIVVLTLDEADRMLDMGFMPQIEKILRMIPRERQTMLFSATIPPAIVKIASAYMQIPVRTEIAPSGTAAENVSQEAYFVMQDQKSMLLAKILNEYHGTVLLFTRTKRGASRVTRAIRSLGHAAAEIHSDRSLNQRLEALEGFKSGQYRILVATDIAARGIDVTGIELVINYDLPDDPENYVHRIGRTGRAGLEGHAVSFATPDQGTDIRLIEKLIRKTIPFVKHPAFAQQQPLNATTSATHLHSRQQHRGNNTPSKNRRSYSRGSNRSADVGRNAEAGRKTETIQIHGRAPSFK